MNQSTQLNMSVRARVWIYPGEMGWHFISLDPEQSEILRARYPKSAMIKVRAQILTINDEPIIIESDKKTNIKSVNVLEWETSLFRNSRDKNYILPIKKEVRSKIGLNDKDIINIMIIVL